MPRHPIALTLLAVLSTGSACASKKPAANTSMPSEWTDSAAEPIAEEPVADAAVPVAVAKTTAPVLAARSGPRSGMYNCEFGKISKDGVSAVGLLYTHPCVIQAGKGGKTTLEKLRGFIRFRGEIAESGPNAFTFAGEVAMGFGAGKAVAVNWSFSQTAAGRWLAPVDGDEVGLEFMGDALEYGGSSYGGYRFGDSRTP